LHHNEEALLQSNRDQIVTQFFSPVAMAKSQAQPGRCLDGLTPSRAGINF